MLKNIYIFFFILCCKLFFLNIFNFLLFEKLNIKILIYKFFFIIRLIFIILFMNIIENKFIEMYLRKNFINLCVIKFRSMIKETFGKILRIKDLTWTCAFHINKEVALGQLVKLITTKIENNTLGVVLAIESYDPKKHTWVNIKMLEEIWENLSDFCKVNNNKKKN